MTKNEAKARAKALVAQMTVEEKLSQLLYKSPAIERLGIAGHNWWNEASHGVARAGMATVFPHAIALAATFDPALVGKVGGAVSTEVRAKYNVNAAAGDHRIYKNLTFWTPNINIFRDPRWGRGQETFVEDPYLTAMMGVEYVRGLQGEGEFLKSAGCAKHYAVHSGPEADRHSFDAVVDEHDLWETYLPAFERLVKAGVAGVMGAYNRTNGQPCCAHTTLMQDILREQWQFDGYYVSDCGAIRDISENHHYRPSMTEGSAVAFKRGCQLNCGEAYAHLPDAYEQDLITEAEITAAVEKLYEIRHLLGEFEGTRPYSDIPYAAVEPAAQKKIAVIGPNAMSLTALEGNYQGLASEYITVADGMRRVFPDADVQVSQGCHLWKDNREGDRWDSIAEGAAIARDADLTVLVLGYDRSVEGRSCACRTISSRAATARP